VNRRTFIKSLGAAGVTSAGLSALPTAAYAQKKLRWRLALAVPKTLPIWGPGIERFADNVKTLTGGGLRIKVYGAGELVPALGTFDAVKAGEIQMGHAASYYWQGKIPATPFFTTIPFGMDANGMNAWLAAEGQALWDELMAPHNVRCIPCGNTGAQTIGWYSKKINSLADLKGLKIRIPGLASKVFQKAGATPVLLPGGELFTSLATGVIDAVEWVGPYHDYTMGFPKAAKYYYGTAWHEPGPTLELMINNAAWDSLPAEYQTAILVAAGETDRWMHMHWEGKNAEYMEKIDAEGKVTRLEFPDDVLKAFRTYTKEILAEISATSPMAKRIADSYSTYQKRFDAYQTWTHKGLTNS
jgi:TRAP-type mannitol/chloroaromatic compound transport system substrate-binding protein